MNSNSINLDVVSLSMNGKVVNDPELLKTIKERIGKEVKVKAAEAFHDKTYTVKFGSNGAMLELTDAKEGKTDRLMRIATIKN